MPAIKDEYYYWDSCVFLSYINKNPERISVLDALWEEISKHPHQKILTSSISIVEIAFASGDGKPQRMPQAEDAIDQLWKDPSIVLIDVFPKLLYDARDLMRNVVGEGYSIKPNDAIHLATAHWASQHIGIVHELHTYDKRINKYSAFIGNLPIIEPYIQRPGLFDNIDES